MFQRQPICHNLLFALRPPPIIARQIAALAQTLGRGAQPAERLHVTLFILMGLVEVDPALVAALRRIGEAVTAVPFQVTFDRIVGPDGYVALRPSRRHPALIQLYDEIAALARTAGLASARLQFNPHISLAYHGGGVVNERIPPIGWLADELVLIDSHAGVTHHEDVESWPLVTGRQAQLSLL